MLPKNRRKVVLPRNVNKINSLLEIKKNSHRSVKVNPENLISFMQERKHYKIIDVIFFIKQCLIEPTRRVALRFNFLNLK